MLIARAPGRVTLIGDHTDYNQGLSLPMAIDLATEATFTPKAGSFLIGVASDQYPEPWEIPLGGTAPDPPQAALAAALVALAHPSSGGALRVTSTLPVGAGLSSSAAFSVAVLLALGGREDMAAEDTLSLARLCQSAEDAAGSRVGLLDPLAILRAQQGHALAIDFARLESIRCRSLRMRRLSSCTAESAARSVRRPMPCAGPNAKEPRTSSAGPWDSARSVTSARCRIRCCAAGPAT